MTIVVLSIMPFTFISTTANSPVLLGVWISDIILLMFDVLLLSV